jgi:hypothetical protein
MVVPTILRTAFPITSLIVPGDQAGMTHLSFVIDVEAARATAAEGALVHWYQVTLPDDLDLSAATRIDLGRARITLLSASLQYVEHSNRPVMIGPDGYPRNAGHTENKQSPGSIRG